MSAEVTTHRHWTMQNLQHSIARLQETGYRLLHIILLILKERSLSYAGEVLAKHFKCCISKSLIVFPIQSNDIFHLHSNTHITHWYAQSRQQNYLLPLCVNRQQVTLNYKLIFHRWLANIVPAMFSGQMTSAGLIERWLYQQVVCWFGLRVKDEWRWNGPTIQAFKQYANYCCSFADFLWAKPQKSLLLLF